MGHGLGRAAMAGIAGETLELVIAAHKNAIPLCTPMIEFAHQNLRSGEQAWNVTWLWCEKYFFE
jgi:hypothetical protein